MFKIIPHTADTRLKVEALTLEALFADALAGMSEIIHPGACKAAKNFPIAESISASSVDETALLIDFLSEVLTLTHEQKAVFCKIESMRMSGSSLEAKIFGVKVDEFSEDIKAVTYHEAEIRKNEKEYFETIIIFDI